MSFKLRRLDEHNLYEHIFESYVSLESGIGQLKQDLGIQDRAQSQLEIHIEPDEENKKVRKKGSKSRTRRIKNKKRESNRTTIELEEHENDQSSNQISDTFDLVVDQSFTSLNSSKDNNNSTTGYVLWSITPFFIRWLLYSESASPLRSSRNMIPVVVKNEDEQEDSENVLNISPLINGGQNSNSTRVAVIELGSGISSLLPVVLSNYVSTYIATDQKGILNKLKENIITNISQTSKRSIISHSIGFKSIEEEEEEGNGEEEEEEDGHKGINILNKKTCILEIDAIDWELLRIENEHSLNLLHPHLYSIGNGSCETVYIIAMDVIYNEFLIKPFLNTIKSLMDYYKSKVQIRNVNILLGIHMRSEEVVNMFLEQAVIEYQLEVYNVEDSHWSQSRFNLYLIQ